MSAWYSSQVSKRRTRLRELLRSWRARLRPADVGLPSFGQRRVRGLRAAEVAELADVSSGWYEQLESGNSRPGFSSALVHRIASALRLTDQERATLLLLALPVVASAAQIFEAGRLSGPLHYVLQTRDFVRNLMDANSFEEAVRAVVEAAQALIEPTCVTVASIENGAAAPRSFAAGPRARFVQPLLAQRMLDMNHAVRSGAVLLCEELPHPRSVGTSADHPVRIKAPNGHETVGMRIVPAATYRSYNRYLSQRSELVTGLFENGTCRGVISCSWTEPRAHQPIEVATIEMLVAMVALLSAPVTPGFR